ncbi:unnamed protein product [Withania somnifera]
MANSKGPCTMRNIMYNGKSSLLPPKSPFPSMVPPYVDYVPSSAVNQKGILKPRDGHSHHQRTSSESCLIEEQPSWLDDLLNEPETPVRRGSHRRSSSDSFAYFDAANAANLDYIAQVDNKFRNMPPIPSWGSQDFDYYKDARQTASYVDQNSSIRHKNREKDVSSTTISHLRSLSSPGEDLRIQRSGSPCLPQDGDRPRSAGSDKHDVAESGPPYPKGSVEKRILLRLRVHQKLTQNVRNMEHEVLEKERGRLRALYQQQQPQAQPQKPSYIHRRTTSRDLDQQLANLSLQQKEAERDAVSGQLHM